ncbi:MAG: hypothetical protein EA381_18175 [Planctomycetaceae bacterium]|nr:MAG: hypothetical protein EA381_18175 [Planctomycetaceae bacterium]
MSNPASATELFNTLLELAKSAGIDTQVGEPKSVAGQCTAIRAKWLLGARKVKYSFRCLLDEASYQVRFRESINESSWGIPPLTFTVEKTSQSGTRVTQDRTDKSLSGEGGHLPFGDLREACEQATRAAGWTFTFEPSKSP